MDWSDSRHQISGYWSVLVQRRWVVVLAVATAGLVALIASFLMTPMYRATTRLQIERHNPDVLTFRDLAQVDYAWSAYSDFYETQYKLISSTAVARIAVERLGLTSHPEFIQEPSKPGILDRLTALIPRKAAPTSATAISPDGSFHNWPCNCDTPGSAILEASIRSSPRGRASSTRPSTSGT